VANTNTKLITIAAENNNSKLWISQLQPRGKSYGSPM
jgi:hypothetical protein